MSRAPARDRRPGKESVGARSFARRYGRARAGTSAQTSKLDGRPLGLGAQLRRVPTAAWVCALIAFVNAFAWSLIVPPFQGKDEVDHFAYVAHLSEKGTLPLAGRAENEYSPAQLQVMEALHYYQVRFSPFTPSIATAAEQSQLTQAANAGASTENARETAGIASPEPPLYYALAIVPYTLGSGNVLVQLQLMRILGTLFGALTVFFTFLFLRECLPGVPWAATVGALCIALQPLLAFMSGSVNPESLLFAIAAASFYFLARAFRRGLSPRLAVALGTAVALGFLTKLNYIGFAFGVYVGLAALAWRAARAGVRKPLRSPAIAAGIGFVPLLLYVLRNLLTGRPTLGPVAGAVSLVTGGSLFKVLSYSWQLFLPRLPGMPHYFLGVDTFKDVWFDRSVGLYGFMDTMFPTWVDNVALVPAGIVALLCARELYGGRHALRARAAELITYAAISVGVLAMLGVASYSSDVIGGEAAFAEPRYLLPMIPLVGAVVALAIRGAGRRFAPVAAAALVVLFFGHDLVSQLQVVARYYG